MLNFRQGRRATIGAAHRAACYFLCLLLAAAGVIELQRHTLHAAHKHDAVKSTAIASGDTYGSGLLALTSGVHGHEDLSAESDKHDNGSSHDHSNTTDCGAHVCLTAITPSEMNSARIYRQNSPMPHAEPALESDNDGSLYRPPIALL